MGRSRNVWGPYEPDPNGPLITSQLKESNERADDDHLKPRYFNPDSVLQKSGHGSYADLPNGETYLVHLTSRPFMPELRCTLGRETAIQKMTWTDDGWLRVRGEESLASLNRTSLIARKLTSVYATVTMVGIAVTDVALHEKTADFDFLDYEADETKPVD